MKKLFAPMIASVLFALPLAGFAGPDETQKALIQQAQDAKKKLAGAESTSGAERQKMMQEHMGMMQTMMAQMQKAKPGAGMPPEQNREWIDEHLKLMQEMMSQMMSEHHMMTQGGGMGMQGMQGMGKK
jgi:methionine synthase I (cobalamin-dependent)